MYTTPDDAPGTYTFAKANSYCTGLDANGHRDWRVPTLKELNVLFNNRAAVGGFNETGSYPAGWYWSSTESSDVSAWQRRFSDGYTWYRFEGVSEEFGSSLRCVRG